MLQGQPLKPRSTQRILANMSHIQCWQNNFKSFRVLCQHFVLNSAFSSASVRKIGRCGQWVYSSQLLLFQSKWSVFMCHSGNILPLWLKKNTKSSKEAKQLEIWHSSPNWSAPEGVRLSLAGSSQSLWTNHGHFPPTGSQHLLEHSVLAETDPN